MPINSSGRADSGKQEKDSGQYQRRIPAVTLADPPGERGAEDTSDQRATYHESLQGVRLIQRKSLRLDEELTQRLYRTGDHRRVIPEQQTSQGSDQGKSENISVVIFHGIDLFIKN